MNRLKILKQILFYLKYGWRYWVIGIILVGIGAITYFLIPYIIRETFVITGGNLEQSAADLNRYQLVINISHYLSIGFMSLGTVLAVIIGEIYAGYAAIEAIRLKNFDKNNFYFDYSLLCILSCFLLPFIFLYYCMAQVRKEVNFVSRDLDVNKQTQLITEDEWNLKDFSEKIKYLDYLQDMNIVTKNEYKYLVKNIKSEQNKESRFYDYKKDKFIGSNEFNKIILDKKDVVEKKYNVDESKSIDKAIYNSEKEY